MSCTGFGSGLPIKDFKKKKKEAVRGTNKKNELTGEKQENGT